MQPPDGPADPADVYWTLTGKYPNDRVLKWIDDLAGQYGAMAVVRAMASCHTEDPDVRTLLGRSGDRMKRDARRLDVAEREDERRRVAEQHRPTVVRREPETISDAEADRIAREFMTAFPNGRKQ